MKKVLTMVAICAAASLASATIYIPGGQFDSNPGWAEVAGGGSGASYSYDNGYGQIDSTAGSWAIWVAKDGDSEEISLSSLGVTAGQEITITMDMKEFANAGGNTAGIKIESWGGGSILGNSGDMKTALTSEWATYTFTYTVDAGADALKFVPVQHEEISVGYDNIGVVPEPATMGLIGLFGGGMMALRRFRIC